MRKILSWRNFDILIKKSEQILTPLGNNAQIKTAFFYKRENIEKVRSLKRLALAYEELRENQYNTAKKRRHTMILTDLKNNLPKDKISRLNQRLSEIRNYANNTNNAQDQGESPASPFDYVLDKECIVS